MILLKIFQYLPRRNLARFLTHYELFKDIMNFPGSIVDLGVFKGASTFSWAKLCEIFCQTDILKKVYAFDTFEGFSAISVEDGPANAENDVVKGGYYGGERVKQLLEEAQEAFAQGSNRLETFKGLNLSKVMHALPFLSL